MIILADGKGVWLKSPSVQDSDSDDPEFHQLCVAQKIREDEAAHAAMEARRELWSDRPVGKRKRFYGVFPPDDEVL
jgi:hypothetical protein